MGKRKRRASKTSMWVSTQICRAERCACHIAGRIEMPGGVEAEAGAGE
jgi:hypothetical protein